MITQAVMQTRARRSHGPAVMAAWQCHGEPLSRHGHWHGKITVAVTGTPAAVRGKARAAESEPPRRSRSESDSDIEQPPGRRGRAA